MDLPRVVVFTPVYPPRKGGSATYFSTLTKAMNGRASFTVICLEGEGPAEDDGVRVLRVLPERRAGSRLGRALTVVPRSFSALRAMRGEGPFVLHAHSNGMYGLAASLFSVLYGVPMLKEVQDTSDPGWALKVGKVRWWIATGAYVASMLEGFGIDRTRIKSFPALNPPWIGPAAEEAVRAIKRPDDKVRLIFVGWLMNRVKGVDDLIEAFRLACAKRGDLELTIVGDGPDRKGLEEVAKGLPVTFTGELDMRDLIGQYARSHIVVSASHEESAGRSYLEGFAFGIPSIGTSVGGTPEIIRDGGNGRLVPDSDPEALSGAMLELAADPDLRRRMGEEGRRYLERLPAWDAIADWVRGEYVNIWMGMTKDKGPG